MKTRDIAQLRSRCYPRRRELGGWGSTLATSLGLLSRDLQHFCSNLFRPPLQTLNSSSQNQGHTTSLPHSLRVLAARPRGIRDWLLSYVGHVDKNRGEGVSERLDPWDSYARTSGILGRIFFDPCHRVGDTEVVELRGFGGILSSMNVGMTIFDFGLVGLRPGAGAPQR
jgi:hypothetical protein